MSGYQVCDVCHADSRFRENNRSFHKLNSNNREKRRQWVAACEASHISLPAKKVLIFCSAHFPPHHFATHGGQKRLHDSACPSIFSICPAVNDEVTEGSDEDGYAEDITADILNADEEPFRLFLSPQGSPQSTARRRLFEDDAVKTFDYAEAPNIMAFLAEKGANTGIIDLPVVDHVEGHHINLHLPSEIADLLGACQRDHLAGDEDIDMEDLQIICDYASGEDQSGPEEMIDRLKNENAELRLRIVELECQTFSVKNFMHTAKAIQYYTGFKDFPVFKAFFDFLEEDAKVMFYLGSKTKNFDMEREAEHVRKGPVRKLSLLDEFFLTMVKLRRNFENEHLAHIFNISATQICRISNTWILLISDRVGQLNLWPVEPPGEMLLVPDSLRAKFGKVICIIDGTEIYIDKPSASVAQKELFSSYKNRVTAKFLVAMDLNGTITFVSRAYAGRTSDKKQFLHCGLKEKVKSGEGIMADRGYDLMKELQQAGISLLIPEYLKGKTQFSGQQLEKSRDISEVRVHVERGNRKIKEFHILDGPISLTLMPMIDSIWRCCSFFANFTGSGYLVKPKQ